MSPHRDREGRTANPPGASSAREGRAGLRCLGKICKGVRFQTSVASQWLEDCKPVGPIWSQRLLQGAPQSGLQE